MHYMLYRYIRPLLYSTVRCWCITLGHESTRGDNNNDDIASSTPYDRPTAALIILSALLQTTSLHSADRDLLTSFPYKTLPFGNSTSEIYPHLDIFVIKNLGGIFWGMQTKKTISPLQKFKRFLMLLDLMWIKTLWFTAPAEIHMLTLAFIRFSILAVSKLKSITMGLMPGNRLDYRSKRNARVCRLSP